MSKRSKKGNSARDKPMDRRSVGFCVGQRLGLPLL